MEPKHNEQQILKFQLRMIQTQVIHMPYAAKILCVQLQNGVPCIWAMCNMDDGKSDRTIDIFGTGQPITDLFTRTYIDTFQIQMGRTFIWHVFERHI